MVNTLQWSKNDFKSKNSTNGDYNKYQTLKSCLVDETQNETLIGRYLVDTKFLAFPSQLKAHLDRLLDPHYWA